MAILHYISLLDETAANFEWKVGTTPLSSLTFLISSVIAYPVLVLFLKKVVMRGRKEPLRLGAIPAIHNLLLCLGSLWMLAGTAHAVVLEMSGRSTSEPKLSQASAVLGPSTWLLCLPIGTKPRGRLFFWAYVYYLSKFYELIDTLVLIFKNKPLTLLHVYHHTVVIIMCYLWLEFSQSLQAIGIFVNTGIHVIMYLYFFLHSMGMPPPWRKFVTNSQIIQFIFSGAVSVPFLLLHFFGPGCEGILSWMFNIVFNVSLLALFVNFHRKQYGQRRKESESGGPRLAPRDEKKAR